MGGCSMKKNWKLFSVVGAGIALGACIVFAASPQELDDVVSARKLAAARLDRAQAALEERTVRAPFAGRILKTHLEAGESAPPGSELALFDIGDTRRLKVVAEVDELDAGRI